MKKILLALMLGIIIGSNVCAYTEGELSDLVRILVKDKEIAGITPYFTDTEIRNLLNAAQYEGGDFTWCMPAIITATLTSNTTTYALGDDYIAPYRVTLGTNPLEAISIRKLDEEYPGWNEASIGRTSHFYEDISTYSRVGFYPPLDATRNAEINVIEIPDKMTSTSNIPFNGRKNLYPYHFLLVLRVASILSLQRGYVDLHLSYDKQYVRLLESMERTVRMKPGQLPESLTHPWKKPNQP